MHDIPGYDTFVKIEPLNKGWSTDEKYIVSTAEGKTRLLRVADIAEHDRKKHEFEMMQRVADMGVPMSQPIDFGTCDNGEKVYQLLSWIDGENAETAIPLLPETQQYVLGVKSGEFLRTIHSLTAPKNEIDFLAYKQNWAERFNNKVDRNIKMYTECKLKISGGEHFINYIEQNRGLHENRPQCFQHGDYHVGNMIFHHDEISIIDFNRCDFGDPWEEFNRIVWSAMASPHFATGQLRGYFNGEPPFEFFRLLAFYISSNMLASVPWAIPFGQSDIDTMMKQAQDVLDWYDNMTNPVPTWYLKDFYIQWTDGVPYKLKEPFDFSFLSKYGKLFKVFDDQDSGNICFGIASGESKQFVKFAGAPTERSTVTKSNAISRMESTAEIYRDLAHPTLTRLIATEEINGGLAMIFEWTNADCMGRMYPQSREKFLQMPSETRLQAFDEILTFHIHVVKQGYVAIDFYDGCIMYDFDNGRTIICDIEFYAKAPYTNEMGRMWGSSRFMSPEEFQYGATIDEITNVYTMGATAFALFGDERDRSIENWTLSKDVFDVAKKAVSDERENRQQSIEQFVLEWSAIKRELCRT